MNVLRLIPVILAWLPHAIAAVAVIEAVLGPGKTGAEKKKLVLDYLQSTATKLGLPWGEQAVRAVDLVIDAIVGIMNFIGAFRHTAEEEPEIVQVAATIAAASKSVTAATVNAVDDSALTAFKNKLRVE
jgi:hypothetical protein